MKHTNGSKKFIIRLTNTNGGGIRETFVRLADSADDALAAGKCEVSRRYDVKVANLVGYAWEVGTEMPAAANAMW